MLGRDYREARAEPAGDGIGVRWVLGKDEGAPSFALRVVEFDPGAVFASHRHAYEHEIFVLEGRGKLAGPDGEIDMRPGVAVFVPPDEVHGYRNAGEGPLRFVCVIPHQE